MIRVTFVPREKFPRPVLYAGRSRSYPTLSPSSFVLRPLSVVLLMTTCPTRETIDDLMANRLPAEQAAQVRTHVGGCPVCQQQLRGGPEPPAKYPFLSPPQAAD